MKNTLLIGLLCGVFAVNVNASEKEDDGFWFPNETWSSEYAAVNNGSQFDSAFVNGASVVVADNNALRLKLMSRRGYRNPAVKNKEQTKPDGDWIGAAYVDEKEVKAGKRLNRQFKSKRAHINYQFD